MIYVVVPVNNKKLLTNEQYNSPHPNPQNSYGNTYGAHREFLEFNLGQHLELKNGQICQKMLKNGPATSDRGSEN